MTSKVQQMYLHVNSLRNSLCMLLDGIYPLHVTVLLYSGVVQHHFYITNFLNEFEFYQ